MLNSCLILLIGILCAVWWLVTFVKRPRWRWQLVAVAAFAIIGGVLLRVHQHRCDSGRWKTAGVESNSRWRMYHDLITQHRLKGMARADVIALLGEPNERTMGPFHRDSLPGSDEFDNYNAEEKLSYYLGYSSIPIDVDVMYLYLKGGVVDRYGWHAT